MTVLIADSAALAEFCRRQEGADFLAVDTEFMRDKTYWPQLCLVQIAGPAEAAAIDPLAPGIELKPLLDLMTESPMPKVFPRRAAGRRNLLQPDRQDAEPALRHPGGGDGLRLWRIGELRDPGRQARRGGNRQILALHRLGASAAVGPAAYLRAR
jgi:hypothetical protein